MVPKGRGGGRGRKEGSRKGEDGKTAGARQESAREPLAEIDPDLAVVIKHPLRVRIVAISHQRLTSPSEFAEESGCTLKQASDHYQALIKADFLELVETIEVRGTIRHMYRATRRAYVSTADWSQLGKPVLEAMGAEILRDFNTRVTAAMDAETFYFRPDTVLAWLALVLDEISWPEFIDVLVWTFKEVKRFEVETTERHARGEGQGCISVTFGIAGFESPTESERKEGEKRKVGRKRKPRQQKAKAPKARGASKSKATEGKGRAKRKSKGEKKEA